MHLGKWIRGWRLDKIFSSHQQEDVDLKNAAEKAVMLVEKVKTYIDNPVADMIDKIIPGSWDNKAIETVRTKLPGIIADLRGVQSTNDIATSLNDIKFSSDDAKDRFYHNLATAAARILSDGKLSFGDAVVAVQLIYDGIKKEEPALTEETATS